MKNNEMSDPNFDIVTQWLEDNKVGFETRLGAVNRVDLDYIKNGLVYTPDENVPYTLYAPEAEFILPSKFTSNPPFKFGKVYQIYVHSDESFLAFDWEQCSVDNGIVVYNHKYLDAGPLFDRALKAKHIPTLEVETHTRRFIAKGFIAAVHRLQNSDGIEQTCVRFRRGDTVLSIKIQKSKINVILNSVWYSKNQTNATATLIDAMDLQEWLIDNKFISLTNENIRNPKSS